MKNGDLSNHIMDERVMFDLRDLLQKKAKIRRLLSGSLFDREYDVITEVEDFLYKLWKHYRIVAFYFPDYFSYEDIHVQWITKHLPFDSFVYVKDFTDLTKMAKRMEVSYLFSEQDDIITNVNNVRDYSMF